MCVTGVGVGVGEGGLDLTILPAFSQNSSFHNKNEIICSPMGVRLNTPLSHPTRNPSKCACGIASLDPFSLAERNNAFENSKDPTQDLLCLPVYF